MMDLTYMDLMTIQTPRLSLRQLRADEDDAAFILQLLNEPSFLRFIGDRGVRTLEDARRYITDGPLTSYARNGFGLYRVALRDTDVPIGMCGLLQRPTLADPDIGFAFFPAYWSQGYGFEAASAVLEAAREQYGVGRVVAIVSPENAASIRLLEKLGLRFERLMRLTPASDEVKFFVPPRA